MEGNGIEMRENQKEEIEKGIYNVEEIIIGGKRNFGPTIIIMAFHAI